MSICARCETLPLPMAVSGTLYIAPPLDSTCHKIRSHLQQEHIHYAQPQAGTLAIRLTPGLLRRLSAALPAAVSELELQDSRSLIMADGALPSLTDFQNVRPLSAILAEAEGEWLVEMLAEERTTSYFQPIVSATNPQQVFAYETLLRGLAEDGSIVAPNKMFDVARAAGLLFHIDRASRLTAIREAVKHHIDGNLFINFNPTSIYSPEACLISTLKAIHEADMVPSRLVFEVVESDEVGNVDHLLGILDFYRKAGYRIALDDLGAGYSSLNLLTRLRPDFVKLDIELVRDVDKDPYKAEIAAALLKLAQKLGIQTIAEGVETVAEWQWVRDQGADYVQGYLFARPGSPPPLPQVPGAARVSPALRRSTLGASDPPSG